MIDFFSRMAERSRGESIVAEPRLPDLFAPVERSGPVTPSPLSHIESEHQNATQHTEHTDSKTLSEKSLTPEVVIKSTATTLGRDNTDTSILPPDRPKSTESVGDWRSVENLEIRALSEMDLDNGSKLPSNSPPIDTPVIKAEKKIDLTLISQEIKNIPQTSLLEKEIPLVPGFSPPVSEPSFKRSVAELTTPVEEDNQRETELHINIGRIEVRANPTVQPTMPRQARSKPQKKLSLNDYLKQSGGRS